MCSAGSGVPILGGISFWFSYDGLWLHYGSMERGADDSGGNAMDDALAVSGSSSGGGDGIRNSHRNSGGGGGGVGGMLARVFGSGGGIPSKRSASPARTTLHHITRHVYLGSSPSTSA